jgi:hypothetical protein
VQNLQLERRAREFHSKSQKDFLMRSGGKVPQAREGLENNCWNCVTDPRINEKPLYTLPYETSMVVITFKYIPC